MQELGSTGSEKARLVAGPFMPHAFRNASLRSKTDVPIAKLRAFLNSIQSATAYETAWRATLRGAAIHYYNQTERLLSVCHITNSAARRVLGIDPTFRHLNGGELILLRREGTCLAMMRGYGARVFANNSARSCCDVGSWQQPRSCRHGRCMSVVGGRREDIGSRASISPFDPGCVKTRNSRERAELFSLSSFNGGCQHCPFLIQCDRDKLSTRKVRRQVSHSLDPKETLALT